MSSATIDPEQSVLEIIKKHPETETVFQRYGLNASYKALEHENLIASCKVHQIELEALLASLNEVL